MTTDVSHLFQYKAAKIITKVSHQILPLPPLFSFFFGMFSLQKLAAVVTGPAAGAHNLLW